MTESVPTGYGESPDTTDADGPVAPGVDRERGDEESATLTTDDDAQREDSPLRPGNEPDVVLAARDRLPALEDRDIGELLGLSLHPLGLGMTDYVGPARDFAVEVRGHGDVFTPYQPVDPGAPGLLLGELALTLGGLAD